MIFLSQEQQKDGGDNLYTVSGPPQSPPDLEANTCFFMTITVVICVPSYFTVRKQEIIKVTEQLIEAISNGDFESYT